MAGIILEQLSKRFPGPVHAVSDVDLEVLNGELLALVGPSGSGKTTLLRLIAGLEDPTAGVITIDGRVANRLEPHKRNLAMVFQDAALYPHMTMAQNLAYPLRSRGVQREERARRVAGIARLLGIEEFCDRFPSEVSGGQQQRVALGRALILEPSCLLLDEPFSDLDLRLRNHMQQELKSLQRRLSITTIHVTHDQESSLLLGDRIAVMQEGRILQVGDPMAVYCEPCNRFVAAMIGSIPMNFLPGMLRPRGRGTCFENDRGVSMRLAGRSWKERAAPVVLGIRPEHLEVRSRKGKWTIPLEVERCDEMGDRLLVHGRTPGRDMITASLPPAGMYVPGTLVHLGADPARLHVFADTKRGERITVE